MCPCLMWWWFWLQVYPQSTPNSAGETSSLPSTSATGLHHPKPARQLVQNSALQQQQQQQQQHSIPDHILRPVAAAYRPALPPNPFNKEKLISGHSPDSSLSSGPPQSATTVSFSTMTNATDNRMGGNNNNTTQSGKSAAEQPTPLPPRPQANPRKKCSGKSDENGATCAVLGRCHCSKRR